MRLLICESPGKIKTFKSILGSGWEVQASIGHVMELADDGADHLGFDLGSETVNCRYVPRGERAAATLKKLKAAVKGAEAVYLATDPDREGEAIAWHLARELRLKSPRRVSFTQITASAVQAALGTPRSLDLDLVSAQRARQCLDKLVGYKVSPLLWRATGGRSAGRVQSATLHFLCEREREIRQFQPVDYWSVWAEYAGGWRAYYWRGDQQEEGEGPGEGDDAVDRKAAKSFESTRVISEAEAERLVNLARQHPHSVVHKEQRTVSKSAPPPFITSSLQQAAGALLGYSPEFTMQVAQQLYEGVDLDGGRRGLITYMRTDSVELAPEFCVQARQYLETNDPANLSERATRHRSRATAQQAHEAIRPSSVSFTPRTIRSQLSEPQLRLYDLIWRRAIASQCAAVQIERTTVRTRSGPLQWQAKGMSVLFAGYSRYWNDLDAALLLPDLAVGQPLVLVEASYEKKRTQPPPRYSEPRLVQLMERRGVGRPSTYASTIKTLKERTYVEAQNKALVPTELGLATDALLARALPDLVDSHFTAQMEASLDAIAASKQSWEPYLIGWNNSYLLPAVAQAKALISAEFPASARPARPREKARFSCPECRQPLVKVPSKKVKRGYFLKCERCPDLVMFWNAAQKQWQRPKPRQS
ncbi:type I DNA topoisomerase [Gloeobacter kilaueensis]|uniref:DNA topoisomerase 1 n=1 Tax=Gloeobacter kilaueensis (strain ATCC BAA-2537 / CCAP 1431/1 / ULC 316 / JS1) TaxID=1183438 RepID=U5QLQ3_GLOK1|nr:type I DNA topoisomerase [Gloeobacter kilaueensis]AGY59907.1 DNA topoisomerase I [Gloeobacter kilaueensis JS1]